MPQDEGTTPSSRKADLTGTISRQHSGEALAEDAGARWDKLEKVTKMNELLAYKHQGFWQCMDTKRDKDYLEKILKTKKIKF